MPTETNFFTHNQELLLLLFQMDDFSALQWVVLFSQRLVLSGEDEERSTCLPLPRAEWGFLLNLLPSPSRQKAVGWKGVSMPGLKTASTSS